VKAGVWRWIWQTVFGGAIVALGAAALVAIPHATLAASCTDTWIGGVDGNFGTAGNWSLGVVPGSSDDTCITATTTTIPAATADTYTVMLNGTFTLHSLTLGGPNGTQTVVIPASGVALNLNAPSAVNPNGVLTLGDAGSGTSALLGCGGLTTLTNTGHLNTVAGGGGNRLIQFVNFLNAAGGTVDLAAPTVDDSCGSISNNGTYVIEAGGSLSLTNGPSFSNNGGSLTNHGSVSVSGASPAAFAQRGGSESGNPVIISGSTLDDDTSGGAGLFTLTGNTTLTGTGANPGVAAGQVVTIPANNSQASVATAITNAGTITLGDSGSGTSALLGCGGTITLTNTGHLNTVAGGGGNRLIQFVNFLNAASGTVDLGGPLIDDSCGTISNNGTYVVEASGSLSLTNGPSFINSGGSLTNNGSVTVSGGGLASFVQRGGTESGNPVVVSGSKLDDDTSAGAGLFTLTGTTTLTGTGTTPGVAAGQVVTIPANNSQANVATPFTNAGTIMLGDAGTGTSVLDAGCTANAFTNTGHLNTIVGGGGTRYLRGPNLNNVAGGIVDLAAPTVQDNCGSTTNNGGTFTIEASGSLSLNLGGEPFVNAGGSLINNGAFTLNGTGNLCSACAFYQRGGTESGNSVVIANRAALDDDLGAGVGNFTFANTGFCGNTLTGTGPNPGVAAGQVVTLAATTGGSCTTGVGTSMTNAGTITLGDAGSGINGLLACGGTITLTNTGRLNTVAGGGGNRLIQFYNFINAASGVIDLGGPLADDSCGHITNNGAITVQASGSLSLSGGVSFSNTGGSLSNQGAVTISGASPAGFVQRGSESGNPAVINGGFLDDDTSAGSGLFTLTGNTTLTGTGANPGVAAGQTVTIPANNSQSSIAVSLTNAGTIILGDAGTGTSAFLGCGGPTTLTNTGHLNTIAGGGGTRYLRFYSLHNVGAGTMDLAGPTVDDNCGTISNDGTLVIEPRGGLSLVGGPSFGQGAGGIFATTIDANANIFGQLTAGGHAVSLDGKLRVTTVGAPSAGSSWPIISGATTRSGQFAAFDICDTNYDVEYAASSVTLVVDVPTAQTASTTSQLTQTSSDGKTWQLLDPTQLFLNITPPADSYAIVSGNADLWTDTAGYNQDIGISVSGGGASPGPGVYPTVAGQPEAWKESGGFAGTFSPNAAFVQTVVFLKQGQPYTIKLVWKANKNAPGATIWAGAGPIGGKYSPTRLTAQLLPASTSNLTSTVVTDQPTQSGSDGATWKNLDPGLSFQYTPCVNGQAVLSGNVDLWTSVAAYNQDVGISVSGGAFPSKPGQPEAWKESGGFAGTFSPNAAFVHGVIPLSADVTYTIKLTWKANKTSPASATIWAGAGPINSQYSPTRLMLQFLPSGGPSRALDAASTLQYALLNSDGATWNPMDLGSPTPLRLQFSSTTACTAIVSANADLWTDTAGYNQDIGILLQGGGYPTVTDQPEAWKESGGFAGTYSPNAAFVQMALPILANTQYTATLQWKANKAVPIGARIWTGAGPIGPDYSPTRLTVQLLGCS